MDVSDILGVLSPATLDELRSDLQLYWDYVYGREVLNSAQVDELKERVFRAVSTAWEIAR